MMRIWHRSPLIFERVTTLQNMWNDILYWESACSWALDNRLRFKLNDKNSSPYIRFYSETDAMAFKCKWG